MVHQEEEGRQSKIAALKEPGKPPTAPNQKPEKTRSVSFECPHSLLKLIQQYREGNPGYSLSQAIRSLITLGLSVKSYTPETVKKAQGIK